MPSHPQPIGGRCSVRERRGAGRGDRLVLIAAAAADTDRADDRSVTPQRDATGKDHDGPVVRCVDAKELLARSFLERIEIGDDILPIGLTGEIDEHFGPVNEAARVC